jgi:hypothetical protein
MQVKIFWIMVLCSVFSWSWGFAQEGFEWVVKPGEYGLNLSSSDRKFNFDTIDVTELYRFSASFPDDCSNKLIPVKKDNLWGYIDLAGKVIINFQFEKVKQFKEGLAAVKKEGKWGAIDQTGKIVIPFQFSLIYNFSEGNTFAERQGQTQIIDRYGNIITSKDLDFVIFHFPFSEGLAVGLQRGQRRGWGFIDRAGKVAIPFVFDDAKSFSQGRAAIMKDGKWGFIDRAGKVAIPFVFDDVKSFSQDRAAIRKDGKWGFIDRTGTAITPNKFDYVLQFKDGLAQVQQNGKWGMIDQTGSIIIQPKFDWLGDFCDEFALFKQNNKIGFINRSQKVAIPCIYDNAYDFNNGFAIVMKGKKYGIINKFGEIVVPFQFDYMSPNLSVCGLYIAVKNDKVGILKLCSKVNINWEQPLNFALTTTQTQHRLKACIESNCQVTDISLYINGVLQSASGRDMLIKPTSCTGQYFEQNIILPSDRTDHEIELVVTTAGGTTRSTRSFKLAANPVSVKPPPPPNEKRVALIIGNRAYQKGSLANPVNDARLMESTLRKMGFKVIIDTNCTQNAIKKAIMAFGSALDENTMALFYYAGHGVEVGGVNYIVPIEAQLNKEADTDIECVKMESVLDQMASAKTKKNILILDACRNDPFKRSWNRSVESRGIAKLNPNYEALVLYAATPGNVADDGVGRKNGLFTEILVKNITTPGQELYNALIKIREEVVQASGEKQSPYIEGTPFRFFFVH